MGMTLVEKILANHSKYDVVKPGENIDIMIDARVARDFGGANVVKNIQDKGLSIENPSKTFFTFDCNPTGSDQKYAINQHICRLFARENNIQVYDINAGIGTHVAIDKGLAYPGSTFVSTDSHANIMGAIGAFGQGMGDVDIAAAFAKGSSWFKVPKSAKITLHGKRPPKVSAKDIVLNLLNKYGANTLLGYSVELYGETIDELTLDERITISSMGTEMGAIIVLLTANEEILKYSSEKCGRELPLVKADEDAKYAFADDVNVEEFVSMASRPGKPHDSVDIESIKKIKIDSAFIGSCTNGRIEDLRIAANVLKNRKVAPGVVLKIVPTTDEVWQQAMQEGLIVTFKEAGALVSNAGCAGCAAGQVGQNGLGEITISTGNRNFPGKQGKGEVYLSSPANVAASAVAGYITTPEDIPLEPALFDIKEKVERLEKAVEKKTNIENVIEIEGRVWIIKEDNIDTDMIFHNRYLTITDIEEMGQYTFDNLKGYEDFAKKAEKGDIVIVQKNFGSGSSRQQAVDCFKALGVQAILAESYGAIYERNAINAAFPILTYDSLDELNLEDGHKIKVNFETGEITNLDNAKTSTINKFSDVQLDIYQNGGLF
ncbi:MAG: 3-isopropylmalate dehydratase large subunit [Melioribacteraceae bacterium]|nr:3-isopropylmalate dehydratase large subunit [Melioribacteraceae bacterium]